MMDTISYALGRAKMVAAIREALREAYRQGDIALQRELASILAEAIADPSKFQLAA